MKGIDQAQEAIRVMVATPFGLHGRGGIDRFNDTIFQAIAARPELHFRLDRLVTRGQGGLLKAQFIFAYALIRFSLAALLRNVDLLHIHLSDKGSSYRKIILGAVARYLGIPYVVHLHGAVFDEFWSAAPSRLAGAINRLFERSEHIIVLGRYWATVVGNRLPNVTRKMSVMPNATLSTRFGLRERRVRSNFLSGSARPAQRHTTVDRGSWLAGRPIGLGCRLPEMAPSKKAVPRFEVLELPIGCIYLDGSTRQRPKTSFVERMFWCCHPFRKTYLW